GGGTHEDPGGADRNGARARPRQQVAPACAILGGDGHGLTRDRHLRRAQARHGVERGGAAAIGSGRDGAETIFQQHRAGVARALFGAAAQELQGDDAQGTGIARHGGDARLNRAGYRRAGVGLIAAQMQFQRDADFTA
ncbi:hypothetical protein E4T56_gene9967, partial [Termitomyces sp. T112]